MTIELLKMSTLQEAEKEAGRSKSKQASRKRKVKEGSLLLENWA